MSAPVVQSTTVTATAQVPSTLFAFWADMLCAPTKASARIAHVHIIFFVMQFSLNLGFVAERNSKLNFARTLAEFGPPPQQHAGV
jgi:hypothetical protein